MKNIQRVLNCRKGSRCNNFFACKYCGDIWQKKNFINVCNGLNGVNLNDSIITYFIISSDYFGSLNNKLNQLLPFYNDLKELKKRNKLDVFYSRLEISFKKSKLGFYPHFNIITFSDIDKTKIKELAIKHGLKVWNRKVDNDINEVKKVFWYILKYNNLGIEKGEAVRIALNKKRTILHSKHFNSDNDLDYLKEISNIDFGFMGVYPIRTPEEILLREEIRKKRQELNKFFKSKLEEIKAKSF